MEEYRILVCGGRRYGTKVVDEKIVADREQVDRFRRTLQQMVRAVRERSESRPIVIIHGKASGADTLAADFVKLYGGSSVPFGNISERAYPADWKTHGRSAGPIRNRLMLSDGQPHAIIAFPGGRGTADMIRQGKKANIPVYEVKDD